MRIGVVFPQIEIGPDPAAVRDYAQAAESLGYAHVLAYDHVLGANAGSRPGWSGAYRHTDQFHEVMVLLAYVAGLTETLELVTGVLILPQRQTALVAKQTAEVDLLSGGRLRLGIGIGWNDVEYEALSEDFGNRGRRSEEQIEVLRLLWTNELVTYRGRWHTVDDGGINPLPVQRPIPVWFGGMDERVLKRLARVGDGWIAAGRPGRPAARHDRARPDLRSRRRPRPRRDRRRRQADRSRHTRRLGPRPGRLARPRGHPRVPDHDGRRPEVAPGPHRRNHPVQRGGP